MQQFERIKGFQRKHYENNAEPVGNEIRYPAQCMCCWDSGLVGIPDELYSFFVDGVQDRPFICSRPTCKAGQAYYRAYNASAEERQIGKTLSVEEYQLQFDTRFNAMMSEALHQYQQEQWRKTVYNAIERAQRLKQRVQELSEEQEF